MLLSKDISLAVDVNLHHVYEMHNQNVCMCLFASYRVVCAWVCAIIDLVGARSVGVARLAI